GRSAARRAQILHRRGQVAAADGEVFEPGGQRSDRVGSACADVGALILEVLLHLGPHCEQAAGRFLDLAARDVAGLRRASNAGEEALPVIDEDVLVLTAKGKAELCAPGTALSAAELEVLVLADDRGSVAAVVNSAVCLEAEAAREALRKLLAAGHLESAADRYKISVVDARDFFKGGTGNASRAGNHLALARR